MDIDPSLIVECSANGACMVIHAVLMSLIIFATLMGGFAYATLLERRLVAWFQDRVGPNRVGPKGLLQPIADGVKLAFKEDVLPSRADKLVYTLAPAIKAVPVLIIAAVIPLGPPILLWIDGVWYRIPLGLADVNVGVLWLLAITSIGTYGVVLAGWASGSKYSMLGGLRSSAQMISYELSLGLSMVVPIMIVGSLSLGDIIDAQANPALGFGWFVLQNPLAAGILMIALLAEVNRAPFDMPEAESELTGGYNTEYSGMKFALLFAGEYVGMIAASAVVASMYFGGYHWPLPFVNDFPLIGPLNMVIKIILFLSLMLWVRATLPRIRYDRLMAFGWKVMLPLSLLAVIWTAISLVIGDLTGDPNTYLIISGILFGLVVLGFLLFNTARAARTRQPVPDLTDSRSGLGWALVQVIGALISPPFLLWEFTVKYTRNLIGFVREMFGQREDAAAEAELAPVGPGAAEAAALAQAPAAVIPAEAAPAPKAAEAPAAAGERPAAASAESGERRTGPKFVKKAPGGAPGAEPAVAAEAAPAAPAAEAAPQAAAEPESAPEAKPAGASGSAAGNGGERRAGPKFVKPPKSQEGE